jgi:hypothetical protein
MNKSPQNLAGDCKGFHFEAQRGVVLEPWLSSQGGVRGSIKSLVLVLAQGTPPLKRKGFATDVSFMIEKIKEDYFVFKKRKDKGYRYEDELGLKKIATVPRQRCQKACWYFLTSIERFCKRMELPL